jgi:asparagine synthetase B (glutamine-hydrolysing)
LSLSACAADEEDSGAQPIVSDDKRLSLAVNGEIYNHRILRKVSKVPYNYKTHSDCEVILPLVSHFRGRDVSYSSST